MAQEKRPTTFDLNGLLQDQPYRFDFFQAVRLIENQLRDLPLVGKSQKPAEDPVRFGQEPHLDFAPSNLSSYDQDPQTGNYHMRVRFMGLLGPNGPMPLYWTQHVHDRLNKHDATISSFFDVFNHRMISLFYRAWALNQQAVCYERSQEDPFARYIASLIGMGMGSLLNRDHVDDRAKLHFSGHLADPTRHPDGLQRILQEYFKVTVNVIEFIGQWMDLPRPYQCQMGQSEDTGLIGETVIVGERVWTCQRRFRLRVGPLTLSDFKRFLPGQVSHERLRSWVYNYLGDQYEWEVQLVLMYQEIPETSLGKTGQLGWTTWLYSEPSVKDAEDLVMDCSMSDGG